MKKLYKSTLLVFILSLCLLLLGCGGPGPDVKKEYKEENYTLSYVAAFEKELTLDEAKSSLAKARAYFATAKSYSYTQTMTGEYDSQYNYQGVTKIDVTGATPLASIELTGTTEYGFYVANNKAYLNYNGYKTSYDVKTDLSDLVEATQESLGAFVSFDENSLTQENLVFAGVDKDDVTVIKYNVSSDATVIIVIHEEKIMKVLYSNTSSVEYISKYDYNAVTVTLPSDLDSYIAK